MNNQVIITCKKNFWFRWWAKPVITTRKLLWFNLPYSYRHSNCKITQLHSFKSWPSIFVRAAAVNLFLVWGDSLSSQTSDDCTLPPPAWKLNEVWKRTGVLFTIRESRFVSDPDLIYFFLSVSGGKVEEGARTLDFFLPSHRADLTSWRCPGPFFCSQNFANFCKGKRNNKLICSIPRNISGIAFWTCSRMKISEPQQRQQLDDVDDDDSDEHKLRYISCWLPRLQSSIVIPAFYHFDLI